MQNAKVQLCTDFDVTLRIGIDGRAFTSPAAGIRRYVAGLTRALLTLGEPLELVALGGRDSSAIPRGVGHVAEPPHPPTNLGWTLVGLPRAARRAAVDIIHAPAYTAPWWSPVPVVVTVHDVSYELHPQWYPYRRDWLRRAFYRRSAQAARHILTVSRFSAAEITRGLRHRTGTHHGDAARRGRGFRAWRARRRRWSFRRRLRRRTCCMSAICTNGAIWPCSWKRCSAARRHFGALPALSLVLVGTRPRRRRGFAAARDAQRRTRRRRSPGFGRRARSCGRFIGAPSPWSIRHCMRDSDCRCSRR